MANLDGTDQAMAPSGPDGEGEADFASLLSAQSGGNRQDQGGSDVQGSLDVSASNGEGAGGDQEGAGTLDPDFEPFQPRSTRLPQPSGEEIEAELAALSRGPFRRILTDFLGFVPTGPALRRFANKNPDKWANAIGVLAQLAGYKKELQVEGNIQMVHTMSDAAIQKRMKELAEAEKASNRLIVPQPRDDRLAPAERAPAPKILAPSRDDSIIDVPTKEVK